MVNMGGKERKRVENIMRKRRQGKKEMGKTGCEEGYLMVTERTIVARPRIITLKDMRVQNHRMSQSGLL